MMIISQHSPFEFSIKWLDYETFFSFFSHSLVETQRSVRDFNVDVVEYSNQSRNGNENFVILNIKKFQFPLVTFFSSSFSVSFVHSIETCYFGDYVH